MNLIIYIIIALVVAIAAVIVFVPAVQHRLKAAMVKLGFAWNGYVDELKQIDWADVTVRATKTFVQIAITYAVTALAGVNFSKELGSTFWIGFILSAGSAGVSAAWNTVLMPVLNKGKAGMDAEAKRLAIARARQNSNAQPDKDDSNG